MSNVSREDLDWLAENFVANLWQVHAEFCTGYGPEHCCSKDEVRARKIFGELRRG